MPLRGGGGPRHRHSEPARPGAVHQPGSHLPGSDRLLHDSGHSVVDCQADLPRIAPARRWGGIDDFGGIAVYLASDASAYHTGEQFVIDGGYTKF